MYVSVAGQDTSTPEVFSDGESVTNSTALANSLGRGFGSALARGEPGVSGVSALISSGYRSPSSTAAATLSWEDTWTISPIDVDLIGQQRLATHKAASKGLAQIPAAQDCQAGGR